MNELSDRDLDAVVGGLGKRGGGKDTGVAVAKRSPAPGMRLAFASPAGGCSAPAGGAPASGGACSGGSCTPQSAGAWG